jgi:methylenetetrahydrofolate reductase (NADPH)
MTALERFQTIFSSKHFGRLSHLFCIERVNRFQTLLTAGHFVVSAELTPPRHHQTHSLTTSVERIATYVDVVQVNDNAMAQARLSPLVAAQVVQKTKLETVVQVTLRHRNRIALQSDLLGLAALGIRNIVILGGHPCSVGSDPDAKDVADITTADAIAAIHRLTTYGELFNGQTITPPPTFYIGTIATPTLINLEASLEQLTERIAQGAKYVQLQATFDLNTIEQWMAAVRARGLHQQAHFLAGFYPFSGLRALQQLHQLPGVTVPESLVERLTRSPSQRTESFKANLELLAGIRAIEGIHGLHFRAIPTKNWLSQMSALLRQQPRGSPQMATSFKLQHLSERKA